MTIQIKADSDDRLLCPRCGAPLYACISIYCYGVVPFASRVPGDGMYAGDIDADPDDCETHEQDIHWLECRQCSTFWMTDESGYLDIEIVRDGDGDTE